MRTQEPDSRSASTWRRMLVLAEGADGAVATEATEAAIAAHVSLGCELAPVAVAHDVHEEEVAPHVAIAIKRGGVQGLRSCGVAISDPHLGRRTT